MIELPLKPRQLHPGGKKQKSTSSQAGTTGGKKHKATNGLAALARAELQKEVHNHPIGPLPQPRGCGKLCPDGPVQRTRPCKRNVDERELMPL